MAESSVLCMAWSWSNSQRSVTPGKKDPGNVPRKSLLSNAWRAVTTDVVLKVERGSSVRLPQKQSRGVPGLHHPEVLVQRNRRSTSRHRKRQRAASVDSQQHCAIRPAQDGVLVLQDEEAVVGKRWSARR
eukprot:scaffold462_cov195-Pinguiococcus_pyrenoidosus.AAC.9